MATLTPYHLDWSDGNDKTAIDILPQTVDTTSTSITLFGKGAPNYGEGQQENFLKLLEHFSSDTAPIHPTKGQAWYDSSVQKLKLYNGSTWVLAGSIASSAAAPSSVAPGDLWWNISNGKLFVWDGAAWMQIYPAILTEWVKVAYVDEYNALVAKYNKIAGTPSGSTSADSYGYGQNPIALATAPLSNASWLTLLSSIRNIAQHQGYTSLVNQNVWSDGFIYETGNNITKGITTLLADYNTIVSGMTNMDTNRFTASASSLESSVPSTGTRSRSTAWNGTITHNILASFNSANHAKQFFNAGGKANLNITIPNSPATNVNLDWNKLISKIGTLTLGYNATTTSGGQALGTTNKGFYDLTSAYQTILLASTTGVYSTGMVKVEARLDNAGTVLNILITVSSGGTVTAVTTSSLNLVKASNVYLNNPVIAYPTVSSGGTW